MEDKNKHLIFTIAVLALLCCPLVIGLCISVMWGWFVTPLGMVSITLLQATGIYLLIRVAIFRYIPYEALWENTIFACYLHTFIALFTLGIGFIVHLGM